MTSSMLQPSGPTARRAACAAAAVSALLAGSAAALGAQADTSARADSTRRAPLAPMIVTAQRRAEKAQAVGVALTPLSARELSARGVVQPNDLQRVVPGLEIEPAFGGGQPQFRLRGIGFSDYATNNTATVGLYQDNVALPFPVQSQGLLFDLARVEVLRGPQGTLYGRNSTGGAINLLSRRPTATRHAGVQLEGGSFGQLNGEGFVSGALTAALRARLSVATQQGGGWQNNRVTGASLGDRDHTALRAQVDWDIAPRVNVLLIGSGSRDKSEGQGLYLFAPLGTAGGTGPTIPADAARDATGWGLRAPFATAVGIPTSSRPGRDNTSSGVSAETRIGLGAAQLTSITAYNTLRRFELADWDASASAESDEAFRSRIRVFSQEVRLAPSTISALDWVVGLYHSRESLREQFYSDFTNVPGIGGAALTTYAQQAAATSAFGQIGWLVRPSLKAIAGARVEQETRELNDLTTGFLNTDIVFVPPTDRRLTTTRPSGKLAIEYTVRPDVMTYASLSRGIKSGGFTAYNTTNVAQLTAFAPEVLDAVEVGVKAEPVPTVRVNGALFHYRYRDQQVLSTVYDQVSRGPIGRIANAARSRVSGGEAELVWQITPRLDVQQFVSVRAGEYTEFVTVDAQASIAAGAQINRDFSGTALNIPRTSLGGAATYRWRLGRLLWEGTASYSRRDVQEASRLIFTPEYDVPAYTLVNAQLTVRHLASRWSVQLWGRNLTDTRYDLTRNFFINARVAAAGAPATAGVRIMWER